MKIGKASQAVLDRSVLRPLRGSGALDEHSAAFGRDWAEAEGGILSAASGGSVCGQTDLTPEMLLLGAANNLSCAGVCMDRVMLSVLFPVSREEGELKSLISRIGDACAAHDVTILGGHTQISEAVSRPVVSFFGMGALHGRQPGGLRPGQDLVMAGHAGMAGSALLAANLRERLLERYPSVLADKAASFAKQLSVQRIAQLGLSFGVSAMHDVSQGGVFGALWEMAEHADVGLETDLKKIPIRQETIEICEFFEINPYQLYGQGALLLGTDRGEELALLLRSEGIWAEVIGAVTSGKDRIIRNGEDVRYLDRPAQDALWAVRCVSAGTDIWEI